MKTISILFISLLLFASCSEAQNTVDVGADAMNNTEQTDEKPMINKVLSAADYKAMLAEGYTLVDVRTPEEFSRGNIEGAININFFDADFKTKIGELDKTKPVMIYCASGNRSGKASRVMSSMGFEEIYDLRGGFGGWPYK